MVLPTKRNLDRAFWSADWGLAGLAKLLDARGHPEAAVAAREVRQGMVTVYTKAGRGVPRYLQNKPPSDG